MNNILVTGATGFIGRYLISSLLEDKNNSVIAVVREGSRNVNLLPANKNLKIIECSLKNISHINHWLRGGIDIFYHLAWEGTRWPERDDKQIQDKNYENSILCLRAAQLLHAKTFIGIGSQAEYGICPGKITEESPALPITEYGKAKLKFFQDGMILSKSIGLKFIWARIFSAYGAGDFQNALIPTIIRQMKMDEPIDLTECKQRWDFIYITDVARALICLQSASPGIYNVASGDVRELKDYIYEIAEVLNSNSELRFGARAYQFGEDVGFNPDISKLQMVHGWRVITPFDNGIRTVINNIERII